MTGPDARPDDSALIDLRILATTDLHMQVLPYDYFRDKETVTGLARLAGLIETLRAAQPNCLLLDNGDFLQGTPMGDLAVRRGACRGDVHPIIAAMNAAGYDAGTLGNHEFNFGLPFLERALSAAAFPLVLANAVRRTGRTPRDDTPFLPPYVILDRRCHDRGGRPRQLRIGVIGLVTPLIDVWDRDHLAGRIRSRDVVLTARAWVPAMRAAGADLVVALHHAGIGQTGHTPGMENAAIPFGREAGVDVQILGHSHLRFPSPDYPGGPGIDPTGARIGGTLTVMPGPHGSELGVLDLTLDAGAAGSPIVASRVRLIPVTAAPLATAAEARVAAAVAECHAITLGHVRQPVGVTAGRLHSYFAQVAPDATLTLLAEAQAAQVRAQLAGTDWAGLPVLSAVAPFMAGGRGGPANYTDIPAGQLLLRHVAEIYHYPNAIRALRITGAEAGEWLERSAAQFRQILPGARDAELIDTDMPSYNFDVIHGLRYSIDLSQPARYTAEGRLADPGALRIGDLSHSDGRPVRPDDRFILATNSYRASGGGHFPPLAAADPVIGGGEMCRDALLRYIEGQGTVTPQAASVWRFAPLPGTTVWFDTGPAAAGLLDQPTASVPRITSVGVAPGGFLRCRLYL